MILYCIKDWDERFEHRDHHPRKDRTEAVIPKMFWLRYPVKLDGDAYIQITERADAAQTLGVWQSLLQLAATCRVRGVLIRDCGRPHTLHTLSLRMRLSERTIERGLERLAEAGVGWVRAIPLSEEDLQPDATCHDLDAILTRHVTARVEKSRVEKSREEQSRDVASATSVDEVVAHYQTFHPKARPGARTRDKIRARLKEGWSVADLCAAIDGNHRAPYHCGENPTGSKHHSLELIVRDPEHVQQFIEVPAMTPSATAIKNRRVAENWVRLKERQDANG